MQNYHKLFFGKLYCFGGKNAMRNPIIVSVWSLSYFVVAVFKEKICFCS